MEHINKTTYQPKLGDANRYENARTLNRELAKEINYTALGIVNNAMSVLEKVRNNPTMKNFHDEKTDGQWMGEWLKRQKKNIVQELYGVVQLDGLSEVPREVENFVKDVYQTVEM